MFAVLRPAVRRRTASCLQHLHEGLARRRISEAIAKPNQIRHISSSAPTRAQYVKFKGGHNSSWSNPSQWSTQQRLLVAVGTGLTVYYVSHLERVPETGRWRFIDSNPKMETKLGEYMHQELVQEFRGKILPPNHPLTLQIRKVVERILTANDLGHLKGSEPSVTLPQLLSQALPGLGAHDESGGWDPYLNRGANDVAPGTGGGGREWNLLVVNDPNVVNAMATYGDIVVFTGLLPVTKDEQGLAAVIGHEIGHCVARHTSERYSRSRILLAITTLVAAALGTDFGIANIATKLLLDLPNSRAQELEADLIGLRLCSKACYDPRAAPRVQAALADLERKHPGALRIDLLATHPKSDRRAQILEQHLPEAYAMQAASPACAGLQAELDAFRHAYGFSGATGDAGQFEPVSRW
ncbi:hypothetical protein PUNSTDRAFT_122835 [Punctularia strigosozonata HHB-11173 SS5]|uniref:Peptidase M48 domain-containing protein n=1 Tax=Punctularia strigosozonata (strain HHB-11173) TaxID=741275 RepID=R7S3Y1_PUNST|nr:uncharacterized protein PUNSTDRAFT_122835 [Punctularia strigosozonata HHB-11173 SS5]EIN04507.1 hypothetical protein PUNSTDRAFT_122835 [Punctularia strigosozonata HHB-11173 SS5]